MDSVSVQDFIARKDEALKKAQEALKKFESKLQNISKDLQSIRFIRSKATKGSQLVKNYDDDTSQQIEKDLLHEMEAVKNRINTINKLIQQLENNNKVTEKSTSPKYGTIKNKFVHQIKSLTNKYEESINEILKDIHSDLDNVASGENNKEDKILMTNVIREMNFLFTTNESNDFIETVETPESVNLNCNNDVDLNNVSLNNDTEIDLNNKLTCESAAAFLSIEKINRELDLMDHRENTSAEENREDVIEVFVSHDEDVLEGPQVIEDDILDVNLDPEVERLLSQLSRNVRRISRTSRTTAVSLLEVFNSMARVMVTEFPPQPRTLPPFTITYCPDTNSFRREIQRTSPLQLTGRDPTTDRHSVLNLTSPDIDLEDSIDNLKISKFDDEFI